MAKSEDYLEELLKEMDESKDIDTDFDENFFDEDLLDEELLDSEFIDEELSEDFLKSFEMALEEMEERNTSDDRIEEDESVDELFGNLDSIISGTNDIAEIADVDEDPGMLETVDSDFSVEDFSYDDVGTDALAALQSITEEPVSESVSDKMPEPHMDDAEADVMKILEGLGDLDLELEMDATTEAERSEESKANDDALLDFLAGGAMSDAADSLTDTSISADAEEASKDDKKKKKSAKKDEKKGFFSKLGTVLFGEDDEDAETTKPAEESIKLPEEVVEEPAGVQEFTDDTLDLFKDFTTTPSTTAKEETKEPEAKKKKKKDKKEKVKKEKKPKPKKEKKPKKPKEPDNTPPLPKKPVLLIILMVASFVVLMLVGTNLLGYSNSLTNAKNAFAKRNYTEAYSYVSGMEIKEKDIPLYEKYQTMALISSEFDAYKNLMDGEFYDMAFDSLIRMIGRCDKFREDALNYGCISELNALEEEAEIILNETFKMTKEEAVELYNYRDRRDYSKALNAILKELGMEKVTEE